MTKTTSLTAIIVMTILLLGSTSSMMKVSYGAESETHDKYLENGRFKVDITGTLHSINTNLVITEILLNALYPPGPVNEPPGPPGNQGSVCAAPGSPDSKLCGKILDVLADNLAHDQNRLDKLKMPPGPPDDKAVIADLNGIINNANAIVGIAKNALGQQAPGPPDMPKELNNIINKADGIATIAKNILTPSAGQLNLPVGVAVDSSNRIIVADANNNRIQVFDSSGNFVFKF